jgi:hypothetical protein
MVIKPKTIPQRGLTLVHVLAAEPLEGGSIKTRSTVRTGRVEPGDRLWFEGTGGSRHTLTVVSVVHTPRWATIGFSGQPEHLARVRTGTYLHAQPAAAVGGAARVPSQTSGSV